MNDFYISDGHQYNIQDRIRGAWLTRYRNWMPLWEAQKKYEWLTNDPYWQTKADEYRIVKAEITVVPA